MQCYPVTHSDYTLQRDRKEASRNDIEQKYKSAVATPEGRSARLRHTAAQGLTHPMLPLADTPAPQLPAPCQVMSSGALTISDRINPRGLGL